MGDSLGAIVEECASFGKPLPDQILEHYELREPWMEFYLGAYNELSGDRGSCNKVTWMAMDRYCERHGFDHDFSLWFIRCLRTIDDAHLDYWRAEQNRRQAAGRQG